MREKYDFSGWATKNDLLCSDGRTIRRDAFKDCDGKIVPLVFSHIHNDPDNVLGHALLKNEPEGVRAYCTFNNTPRGKTAKELVAHGDITNLSIYANKLKQQAGNVMHGVIREVSLVLSGANPGAVIDFPTLEHDDGEETEAFIYTYTDEGFLFHSDEDVEEEDMEPTPDKEEKDSEETDENVDESNKLSHSDNKEKDDDMAEDKKNNAAEEKGGDKTVQEVFDGMTEEQQNVCYFMIGQALEDAGVDVGDEEGDKEDMKHNVFDNEYDNTTVLTHSDQAEILDMAKQPGMSFQTALNVYAANAGLDVDSLQHDAASSGFIQPGPGVTGYTVEALFPEYKDVRPGAPELITNDQGWVGTVLQKVHKSPISRIRTQQVDIRNIDSLRAKGYKKGKEKTIAGNFQLVRRTTDPQTIYVKSQLHRDDIIDITDFDYVQYLYNIDRMNLNEELATAIMLGDGREDDSEYKIAPEHIRPIWLDDELYTKHVDIDIAAMRESLQGTETGSYFGDNYVYAEALIEQLLYARETFKGTGTPDFFMTPHMLNVMLLARDRTGHRIFSSKGELASALNVSQIYTAEQFANKVRTDGSNNQHKLLGICVNLSDYSLGSTKGGEITHFTDFDIDFNTQKSLLETRCSGALTRVYSAIVIEEPYSA